MRDDVSMTTTRTRSITSTSTKSLAPRCTRWQAPSGRWVEPGTVFFADVVEGKRKFKFLAFVDGEHPFIEAVQLTRDAARHVRCIRPEKVGTVRVKEVAR